MAYDRPTTIDNNPVFINWKVVRGDTSSLTVQFLELDEVTSIDTTGWIYEASSYNPKTGDLEELDVEVSSSGEVTITATADITENWGTGSLPTVAELSFDLQVILADGSTWTPVLGTITVRGDVTGGSL